MVGVLRLENVRELTQRAIDFEIPGDFMKRVCGAVAAAF